MPCYACGSNLIYTSYQGFPLCRRCYSIAEQLLPLMVALDNLKYFKEFVATPEFKERVDELIKNIQILLKDFADSNDREADDPLVNALNRVLNRLKER